MTYTRASLPALALNFVPVTFSAPQVAGFVLPYPGDEPFHTLQEATRETLMLRRGPGGQVEAVPLTAAASAPRESTAQTFSAQTHWGLFERLLEEGLRRFLQTQYGITLPTPGPLVVRPERPDRDLVRLALSDQPHLLTALDFLRIYRRYRFTAAHIRVGVQGPLLFGLVLKLETDWQIRLSIAELVARGVEVRGCYVIPAQTPDGAAPIGERVLGRIARVRNTTVELIDARDAEQIDARHYRIEASLDNVTRCLQGVLGAESGLARQRIEAEVGAFLQAPTQQQRIQQVAADLHKQPLICAAGLTATVAAGPIDLGQHPAIRTLVLEPPRYVLKYTEAPVPGPVAPALQKAGPLDQDSFKQPRPYVLFLTPKHQLGRVEQFLRRWRDTLVRQYRLRACDLYGVDFIESRDDPGGSYRDACLRALQASQEALRRYDLAFVVVRAPHRLLGQRDPYLISKATLMSAGIPVQEIQESTLDKPRGQEQFILNNLALAAYAKMGGVPWLLASPRGQGIAHELVVGLGSVILRSSRLGGSERYVGITTLFNYDGLYMLSNLSRESDYDDYVAALRDVLRDSLEYISIRKGWQPGDRVRLIFHTTKRLKHLELHSVKQLVTNHFREYQVDFAFLELGQHHDWMMYDPAVTGRRQPEGSPRGAGVPARGTSVLLDDDRAIVAVTGAAQLKQPHHGCPSPLQIRLHPASTFPDLPYLVRQVFEFTHMSWKTFDLPPEPITILYSGLIARHLARLRRLPNWNADALQTTQLGSSLWFL